MENKIMFFGEQIQGVKISNFIKTFLKETLISMIYKLIHNLSIKQQYRIIKKKTRKNLVMV